MTGFAVPCPELPEHVRIEWTPTGSGAVVSCTRCNVEVAIYTTALRINQQLLEAAVEEHRGCPELA